MARGIIGVGTDLVSVDRLQAAIERHGERFVQRIFTAGELAYARARRLPEESLAARFAAKEAAFKAVGVGWPSAGVSWRDAEVVRGEDGPPRLLLSGQLGRLARARGCDRIHLSLSHAARSALAFVVLEGDQAGVLGDG